jgi:hypothetical protein
VRHAAAAGVTLPAAAVLAALARCWVPLAVIAVMWWYYARLAASRRRRDLPYRMAKIAVLPAATCALLGGGACAKRVYARWTMKDINEGARER